MEDTTYYYKDKNDSHLYRISGTGDQRKVLHINTTGCINIIEEIPVERTIQTISKKVFEKALKETKELIGI